MGKTLEKKGFKYIGKEKGVIWTFVRNVNDVKEEVYIQQHSIFESEYKLIMWSSAKRNGEKESKKKLRNELIIHSIIMIILFIICVWDRKVNIPKFPKKILCRKKEFPYFCRFKIENKLKILYR